MDGGSSVAKFSSLRTEYSTNRYHFASTSYASIFWFINRSDMESTSSVAAIFSFSALLKSITRYLGTLFFRITAVPCSSTTLVTLEKFWFASVIEIIVFVSWDFRWKEYRKLKRTSLLQLPVLEILNRYLFLILPHQKFDILGNHREQVFWTAA